MLKCTGKHIIQTKVGNTMNIVRFALPMVGNDELGYRNVEGARSSDVNCGKCHPIACPTVWTLDTFGPVVRSVRT